MCKLPQIWSLILAGFLLYGCGPSRPTDILTPEVMESFLYDYHLAKAYGDNDDYTQRYKRGFYLNYAYEKHNLTPEEVDKSMMWYTRHVGELKIIYDNISKRFESNKEEIDQLVAWQYDTPLVTASGDSVDVWAWHRVYRLTGTPLNNKMIFNLPVDTNFVQKDSINWAINYHFESEQALDSLQYAVMQLALFFSNDSSMIQTRTIKDSGIYNLSIKSDSLWDIKNIQGFVYLPPQPKKSRLLLDSISMYRYHPPVIVDSLTLELDEIEILTK